MTVDAGTTARDEPPVTFRAIFTTKQGILALSLVSVELVAGMQVYLAQAILPILAADLNGRSLYGVVTATSVIANLIALPIGAQLLGRMRIPRLLLIFTVGIVIGAFVSASAPNMWMFIAGRGVSAFCGGAIATISMGAVAIGLKGMWRRLTLAFMSAVWMISSVAGPLYAVWATHALSWRWAMVVYLPLLLIGRWLIGMNMRDDVTRQKSPLRLSDSFLLAGGVSLLTFTTGHGAGVSVLGLIGGVTFLGLGAVRLLPRGTFRLQGPRRSAIATMFGITGVYFAANASVSIVAHDYYQVDERGIGLILGVGGFAWAVTGLIAGSRPPSTPHRLRMRVGVGLGLIAASLIGTAVLMMSGNLAQHAVVFLTTVWGVAGLGMGLSYLDTMNLIFEEPTQPDGISQPQAAASPVLAESISTAASATLATTLLASSTGLMAAGQASTSIAILVLAAATLLVAGASTRLAR